MSLASTIKEFAELVNQLAPSESISSITSDTIKSVEIEKHIPLVLQQAFLYMLKSLVEGAVYLVTFQWLRDLSYLPLLAPEWSAVSSFSLSQAIPQGNDLSSQLLAGLLNSFFFSLPLSLPHFVSIKRLFSQGITAAAAATVVTVTAHSLLLAAVRFGIRPLIIPYYSLQPLTFLIGLFTIAIVINELVQEKKIYLVPLKHLPSLVKIGVLNFILAFCEETTLFHSFHNLTFNASTSCLQGSTSHASLLTVYLLSFFVGHFVFSFGLCFLLLKANSLFCSFTGWTLTKMARRINRVVIVVIVALTFSSFPYYGLDYLFTTAFLPEDPVLHNTVFSPITVNSRNTHFKSRAPIKKSPLELDLNYFDRGLYLNAPKEEKSDTTQAPDPAVSFEELNYRGEYAWLMRHERARRLPEEQDGPRTDWLRLQNENRQAQPSERTSFGHISELREGGADQLRDRIAEHKSENLYPEPALQFERETVANYSKGFASTEESENTPPDLLPVENIIKKRYLVNPVYRALLKTDIDSFLRRQPLSYRTAQNQEHSLFKKRQLLEKYYNWLRYYSPLEPNLSADSFVEKVYHQQFKGTLTRVKRLFKVTFDPQQNPTSDRVLSYDQALYSLPFKNQHPSLHEELSQDRVDPFFEASKSAPIYAGWDEKAHKFVLTNRFFAT